MPTVLATQVRSPAPLAAVNLRPLIPVLVDVPIAGDRLRADRDDGFNR